MGMWRRAQAIGDKDVARQMRKVFGRFPADSRHDPAAAAKAYGQLMFTPASLGRFGHTQIRGEKQFINKCFNVALRDESCEFEQLTKRVTLVSDSLLLSHGPDAPYCHLGENRDTVAFTDGNNLQPSGGDTRIIHYGIHCPDLAALGTWLLEAEPLIKAGLAWYLPSYSTRTEYRSTYERAAALPVSQIAAVDYIIRGGKLIDSSESNPVKDRLVRPILQIDLPFIDDVTLRDFSKITVDEFDSYKGFRGFLRTRFLSIGEALNAEQSQLELAKLRLEIEDQVSAMQAELYAAKRKKSLGVVGATVASTAALLVAVEGSVMERVLTTLGLTTAGTFWGAIKDRVENGPRAIQNGKWYYVWILARKSRSL